MLENVRKVYHLNGTLYPKVNNNYEMVHYIRR